MKKKILSAILVLSLMATMLSPMNVSAEEISDTTDFSTKVVGANGIEYDDVAYLSSQTYNSLPEDGQEFYKSICDEVARLKECGSGVTDVVIAVNENKELTFNLTFPFRFLSSETVQQQFIEDPVSAEAEAQEATAAEEPAEEKVSGAESSDEAVYAEADPSTGESAIEETKQEDAVTEATSEDSKETSSEETAGKEQIADQAESDGQSAAEEPAENAESPNASVEEAKETEPVFYMENADLAAALEIHDEEIEGIEPVAFNTLHPNEDFFKNQLSASDQQLYTSAKISLVNKHKNSFSFKGRVDSSGNPSVEDSLKIINVISALINTYPNNFNYLDRGADTFLKIGGTYNIITRAANYKVTLSKSKHYNKSLESNAKKKVDTLVKEAYEFAEKNYPNDPTYGICYYFNGWIVANNYYNMDGTYDAKRSSKEYYLCHSCYGTLLNGYGVCESYALTMSRLLDAAGIRNLYVVGDAGGGHAWNYVQMPDGKWYLLDSTWNDDTTPNSTTFRITYFLVGNKNDRTADGRAFMGGKAFSFEALSAANYAPIGENSKLTLDKSLLVLKAKKKQQLKVSSSAASGYYDKFKFKYEWSSADKTIAGVDKKGKVSAKKPGQTSITVKLGSIAKQCSVCVYQIKKLSFENRKASFTKEATAGTPISIPITVEQNGKILPADALAYYTGISPTVKSGKSSVAEATCTMSGDNIILNVVPKAKGTAKITVKFDGKTAKCTVKVK